MLGLSRLRIGLMSSSASSIGGFSPLSLFASGEQGAWYDPSDLTTMFQDTAGTTPVTATGQTVGLLLDKSKGLVLGPELVTNGDFAVDANWTKGASWTISGGTANYNNAGAAQALSQNIALTAGVSYLITYTVSALSSGFVYPRLVGSSTVNGNSATANGTYSQYVVAPASPTTLGFVGQGVFSIDNVSVKELPGNHATQATAASRPIYGIEPFGGRRNLLTYTEQFDNAAWGKTRSSVTPNSTTAPDGTLTADTLVEDATASSTHYISQASDGATATRTYSIYAKANTRSWIWLYIGGANQGKFFNLSTGVVGNDVVGAPSAATIQNAGNGWYRCSITVTGTHTNAWVGLSEDGTTISYTGNGTSGAFIWGAQLETGSTATAYQRVTDQWNVTQAGVPSVSYLAFDGTDDFLLTGTITPGIDKAQVFAGVRKLSDAALGALVESSSNPGAANPGWFTLSAPRTAATGDYSFNANGTATATGATTGNSFAAPITNVLTGTADLGGDNVVLRVNGVQQASSALDRGTGNFLAYPLYIGRRGGTSLPFNGRIYQMIVRFGANLSAATITQTENYTAGKTGIYTVEQLIRLNTLNASGVSYNAYAAADSNGNNYPVTNTVLAANGTPYSVL